MAVCTGGLPDIYIHTAGCHHKRDCSCKWTYLRVARRLIIDSYSKTSLLAATRTRYTGIVNIIHGVVRCTDFNSLACSALPFKGFRGCVLSFLLLIAQHHTPVFASIWNIRRWHVYIFRMCKVPLLSCNATQRSVNILTWVSNLANYLTNVKSSAWLGARDGIANALQWSFDQEGVRTQIGLFHCRKSATHIIKE